MANQYDTFALAKAATIPSSVNFVQTLSYTLGAPDSGLQYRKVASNPGYSEPAAFQSADGAWWLFDPAGGVTPDAFGAKGNGVQTEDDAPAINLLTESLSQYGGGTIRPRSGAVYILGSLSGNGLSCCLLRSKVNIIGNGFGATFKLKAGVNTGAQFWFVFYNDNPVGVRDVTYSGFTIDFDGANNTGGNAAALNVAIGCDDGDNITVDGIKVINNPGSVGIAFGRGGAIPPSVNNLRITRNRIKHSGDAVNPGCIDHSSIWVTAGNTVIAHNVLDDGAKLYGTGIEAHGDGVLVANNAVADYSGGLNMANDITMAGPVPSHQLSAIGNNFKNVTYGIAVFAKPTHNLLNILIADNNISLDPLTASVGIDAANQVDVTANGVNITITGNVIAAFGMVSSATSIQPGIALGPMYSIQCTDNHIYNTQGPGIHRTGAAKSGSIIKIDDNIIVNPGLGTTASGTYQVGILVESAAATPAILSIRGNDIAGVCRYGINGGLNVATGQVLGNSVVGASVAAIAWTGTGITRGVTQAGTAPNANFSVVDGAVTRVN